MDFPAEFLRQLDGLPGYAKEEFIASHDVAAPVTSIRLNPAKLPDPAVLHFVTENLHPLEGNGFPVRIPWTSSGYSLATRPFFTYDPLLHAGGYYVQEASSMFLEHIFRGITAGDTPLKVLDLCAAPGGKSTLLQSVLHKNSLLVANEAIRGRVAVLTENLTKWGAENVVVTNNDPSDFARLPHFFDVMLIDAPCSGSGLFRRDPKAMEEWSLSNVTLCQQRQQRIIADAWPALKPGGLLLYATCSFSREEDEDIADWIASVMDTDSLEVPFDPTWGIIESRSNKRNAAGYRCWPHRVKGEGFFIAAFRKKGETPASHHPLHRRNQQSPSPVKAEGLRAWLSESDDLSFYEHRESIRYLPRIFDDSLRYMFGNRINIVQYGVAMGKPIKEALMPHAALALCGRLSPSAVRIPLNLAQSLHYLRRDEIILSDSERMNGWALASYNTLGLGWMKVLQRRVNNYFPKEWRILKDPFN